MTRELVERVGWLRWTWKTVVHSCSKYVLRRDIFVALPTGLRISLPRNSDFGTEAFKTGCDVDWGSERIFADVLDPTGVVLDVGAHIGYYTLYVLPCVSAVHAFEPDPRPRATLMRNLAGHEGACIHPLAVGSREGKAKFVSDPRPETSHLSNQPNEGHDVDIVTVDSFVLSRGLRVTGIKIDVEGWDLDVVEGAIATLESQSPVVLTEAKPEARLFSLITPFGYRVFAFTRDPEKGSHPLHGLRFRLSEIKPDTDRQTKMLFLVPPRLQMKFDALVAG